MNVKPGLVLLLALTGMQMQSVKSMKTAKEGFVEGKTVLLMLTVASMSARMMCVLLKGKVSSPCNCIMMDNMELLYLNNLCIGVYLGVRIFIFHLILI